MMKKILPHYSVYFALIFCGVLCLSGNLRAQTKSPVKSETEFAIETKGGKSVEIKKHYQEYDQHGNLVNDIDYDSDGKLQEQTKYEYNNQNLKVKEIHFNSDGKIDEISTYEYDAKGNRTSKIATDGNGKLKSKKKYVYEYF